MRTSAIQLETFGANTSAVATQATKKGYSVLIGGQRYIVGPVKDRTTSVCSMVQANKQSTQNLAVNKLNFLA